MAAAERGGHGGAANSHGEVPGSAAGVIIAVMEALRVNTAEAVLAASHISSEHSVPIAPAHAPGTVPEHPRPVSPLPSKPDCEPTLNPRRKNQRKLNLYNMI